MKSRKKQSGQAMLETAMTMVVFLFMLAALALLRRQLFPG